MTPKLPPNVPATEYSEAFDQGRADRMATSYFKYGPVAEGFPNRVRAVRLNNEKLDGTLEEKLQNYRDTGNTEWLMDVANYAMIEFMHPRHPDAHFRATDSQESSGRMWRGEIDPIKDPNRM